jgi:hypothetical protein
MQPRSRRRVGRTHPMPTESFKYPPPFPLSQESDIKMNPYTFAKVQEAYFTRSQYEPPQSYGYRDSLFQLSGNRYLRSLEKDIPMLQESLAPAPATQGYPVTLAEQVFGQQKREHRTSLKHLVNLLYERSRLYRRHLRDIDHRLMDCQSRLSIARLLSPVETDREAMNLEKLIVALEKDRRKAELDFWKDSKELREGLFEQAMEYGATSRRARMLSGLEEQNA